MASTSQNLSDLAMNHDNVSSDVMSMRSPSPHHSSATHTPVSTPNNMTQIDIKPNIQNLQYNGMPLVNMQAGNMEIATLFFNQNFNQPNHQNN